MTYVALRLVDSNGLPIRVFRPDQGIVFDTIRGSFQIGDIIVVSSAHLEFSPGAMQNVRVKYRGDSMHLRVTIPALSNAFIGDVLFKKGSYYLSLPGSNPNDDTAYARKVSAEGILNGRRFDGRYVDSVLASERALFDDVPIPDTSFVTTLTALPEDNNAPFCYRVMVSRSPRRDSLMRPHEYADYVLGQEFLILPPRAIIPIPENE